MPLFSFTGVDRSGDSESGTINASSEKLAFETLQSRGITVFDLSQKNSTDLPVEPWYSRDISLTGSELSYEDQAVVADLLAALFGARITISEILQIMILSAEKPKIKSHFERVEQQVSEGVSFSEAFSSANKDFSPIFVSFLRVGDTANSLPYLLSELSKFFKNQNAVRQRVISALIYPAILVLMACALVLMVVLYLAPSIEPIFSSVGKDVPDILGMLLAANFFLKGQWVLILSSIALFAAVVLVCLHVPTLKSRIVGLRYQFPFLGPVFYLSDLSRLSRATGLLLSSGRTLPDALRVAERTMRLSGSLSSLFEDAAEAVESGLVAADVFDEDTKMPPSFKELFRIGERTNNLPSTLAALSDFLSSQLDRKTQRFLSLLTPLLTLVLGLGIGFLVYTLMGAVLEVNEIAF